MILQPLNTDITTLKVDAIVNAANSSLLGGGGVDGAIHRKGGSDILDECRVIRAKQGKCKTGEAVITTAGKLPAKFVIHTVGPVFNGGDRQEIEEQLLANCYLNSLQLALEQNIKTIAFPNISTGIFRFPKDLAAKIAIKAVNGFKQIDEFDEVTFVCFDEENYTLYNELINNENNNLI